MSDIIKGYIQKTIEMYNTGHAREHAYRPALHEMFEKITGLRVVNDPKRSENGAPDFVFLNKKIVTAYAEAKDISVNLKEVEKTEQMGRYFGYSNLIITNSLEFRFYKNGQAYGAPIVIASLLDGKITVDEVQFKLLEDTIRDFIKESKEPIKSGAILSKVMAGKARRIRDNIKVFLSTGDSGKNKDLLEIFDVIKKFLLADLDKEKFADMYAQTLVYGLFVARYYDKTQDNFTRQEARDLVPASNPFLRHFFDHIAGSSFDQRIEIIISELCEEFTHTDVQSIVHNYYKVEKDSSRDPIIHFYEDFLQEYDAVARKKMGVFYTPLPVVQFIIRATDHILKKDFSLERGIADSSKIEINREIQGKKKKVPVHQVQILDPATGTGTFLNEIILHIRKTFVGQEGAWPNYVAENLLPRLHGFELMMASYTIAHLKLSTTIMESGAKIENRRLGVYLTNSLEEGDKEDQSLFAALGFGKALTEEANQANKVKNELPIMVVLGNPPYSVSSQNKGEWIQALIKDYKKDLNERKINLDDDYIKFIRFAEHFIEKNGSGIVAMITNNSFIDGITHRQMRKHLLGTFDDIYILDLHGNSKKKEKAPDGGKDENVFDIQQGVSISIFVRKIGDKNGLGTVCHAEIFGKREHKFNVLNESNIDSVEWKKLDCSKPNYFFVPKDFGLEEEYSHGFKITDLFPLSNTGIQTKRDDVTLGFSQEDIEKKVADFLTLDEAQIRNKYSLPADGRDWTIEWAKKDLQREDYVITDILYRPFDIRKTAYTGRSKGFQAYPRETVSKYFINRTNIGLVAVRMYAREEQFVSLVTKTIIEKGSLPAANYSLFPLYLYAEDGSKFSNFKKEIVDEIEKVVGQVSPEDIFDYIYAVLHSPSYREKYKEFLKIDFPRVPYPKDAKQFKALVALGKELRELHLLESPKVNQFITTYPVAGSDMVEKLVYQDGKVVINKEQYFGNVPETAWNFYIGGYQPAQKWLKDRKGRTLANADIEHYQKMIVALVETGRIMGEIEKLV